MNRSIAVHEILRYPKPNAVDRLTHTYRNYWVVQRDPADPEGANLLQEAGINAPRLVSAPEGQRLPLLSLRSTPVKSGTVETPWHDDYRMDAGKILYYGDHKVTSRVPLGETAGNKRLLDVWAKHRSGSASVRASAPPVLVFRTVTVQTPQGPREKGFIEFCGLVVIEDVQEVILEDPTTGRAFPNYLADLAVLSLEEDRLNWRWVDARRKPWLSVQATLQLAPRSWREWIADGAASLRNNRRLEATGPFVRKNHLGQTALDPATRSRGGDLATPVDPLARLGGDENNESNLEQHFRAAFSALLHRMGASHEATLEKAGDVVRATVDGIEWHLEPQVPMHGCRPDFVLTSSRAESPVAIFTDGFGYHASPNCNRLADDARKRANLRAQGIEVIAVTYADLKRFVDHKAVPQPQWYVPMLATVFKNHFGYDVRSLQTLLGGPFAWLEEWMRNPRSSAAAGLAAAMPMFFAGGPAHAQVPTDSDIQSTARQMLVNARWPRDDGGAAAWWWRHGAVGVLTRAQSVDGLDIAVLLDDRPEVLAAPSFADDWREWLRLSNALSLRATSGVTIIATLTSSLDPNGSAPG